VSRPKKLRWSRSCVPTWIGPGAIAIVQEQIAAINRERDEAPTRCKATEKKRVLLTQLKSIGPVKSAVMSREAYYRQFNNRRQLASFLGLATSPYDSGDTERSQGISRTGRWQVRGLMIQAARLWIKHQPKSTVTRWFLDRTMCLGRRVKRIVIIAVARKLAVALWRYVKHGLVPQGAILVSSVASKSAR
jgi:transposase